jgi:hypothetical protein
MQIQVDPMTAAFLVGKHDGTELCSKHGLTFRGVPIPAPLVAGHLARYGVEATETDGARILAAARCLAVAEDHSELQGKLTYIHECYERMPANGMVKRDTWLTLMISEAVRRAEQ